MTRHLETGEWGEQQAVRVLKRKKYRILGRRVRVGERDEIDVIARSGQTLVFVEVKTRASEAFGAPVVAVDANKRRLLSRAAVRYLKHLKRPPAYFRFDVMEVIGAMGGDTAPEIRHIENAFPLDGRYVLPY